MMVYANRIYERETENAIYFLSGVFSNFHNVKVNYNGITFNNSESAYMYAKAKYFNDHSSAEQIIKCTSAHNAKKIGKAIKGFNQQEWENVRYIIMYNVVYTKFHQNLYLKNILLNTNDKLIVECSKKDTYWGIGLYPNEDDVLDQSKWNGENSLGMILMEVREKLKLIDEHIDVEDEPQSIF